MSSLSEEPEGEESIEREKTKEEERERNNQEAILDGK
jgi:hypothetical protein